jgi:hypothetical protein
MNLETRKQQLMDQLSEAYFAAIELKAEAEKHLAELEAKQEGIWLDQEQVLHQIHLVAPAIFSAIAALEEIPAKFPTH